MSPAACLLLLCFSAAAAIPIDNDVIGIPHVQCEDHQVTMTFDTERPFTGRVFVKGLSDSDECVQTYRGNGQNQAVFQLKAGLCNMRRHRRLGPQRGVETSMTVIFSFHDTFITSVDKAYRCTCFFMEADKVVHTDFTVSMLPTTDLFDTARMPVCRYSVRQRSVNGPIVQYAKVGEQLYHVWDCDSDMFGMLVHSCHVDDGSGSGKFQLLDQHGCAIDPVILGDLQYDNSLGRAFVEAQAFKFADKVTTYFQCAVSLCMIADGACVGLTPPKCDRRARFRRDVSLIGEEVPETEEMRREMHVTDHDLDVSAGKLYILDIDDDVEFPEQAAYRNNVLPVAFNGATPLVRDVSREVCLSPHSFGFMLASFLLVTTLSLTISTVLCMRNRQSPLLKA